MMTGKRFKLVEDYLIEYDGDYFDLHKPSDIRSLIKVIGYVTDENEQLKQQMQRLYNYFADWFDDRVPPNDFSEMWDFVKDDEKWD